MSIKELAQQLFAISHEKVVIRGCQYAIKDTFFPDKPGYKRGMEIQAVVCHPHSNLNRENDFLWVRYRRPSLSKKTDPPEYDLFSCYWLGDKDSAEAWRILCDTWVENPSWLSSRSEIYCRRLTPAEELTPAQEDVIFLRAVDRLCVHVAEHEAKVARRFKAIANNTPIEKRGKVYSAELHAYQDLTRLLNVMNGRLKKYTDMRFEKLATAMGIVQVESGQYSNLY